MINWRERERENEGGVTLWAITYAANHQETTRTLTLKI